MIQGEKVRLRPLTEDDLPGLCRWLNDPEVMQFWDGRDRPVSLADVEGKYLPRIRGHDPVDPTVRCFTIEADGQAIGLIQYAQVDMGARKASIDILIGERAYWDRGYGTDAVHTFLRHLFDDLNLHRVWLEPRVTNERAIHVYEKKCGFVREGILRDNDWFEGRYAGAVVMAILEDEFRSQKWYKTEQDQGGSH